MGSGVSPEFQNKPLSNFDILAWVKQLGIKRFRGVFSRNNLPQGRGLRSDLPVDAPYKEECGIINLDDSVGPGTHWVCYAGLGHGTEIYYYFDSFGLAPPEEILKYIPNIKFNNIQYQDKQSFLCGYYCLFFIHLLQNKVSLYEILYKHLNINSSMQNERTVINYFKTI